MSDRDVLTITSRERLRQEIAQQTELFLREGGYIEQLQASNLTTRPVGPVWWDVRGSSALQQA
ncbi:MAG TPA: hypothetical protein VFM32_07005 [Spongiibacteraceae bacterium]|nr:hypothetical protein [Spongiibacteraceae bacterium]